MAFRICGWTIVLEKMELNMKKILLLINAQSPPYSSFAVMLKQVADISGQFQVEISTDRQSLTDLSGFDAVALYILGGEFTP